MKKLILISTFLLFLTTLCVGQNPFITQYTIEDGLPTNKIYCVLHDSKGFLWFGCDVGVIRYDGTNFNLLTTQHGLDYNGVIRIKEDSKGRIWIMNFDGSLNYYENNQIFNKDNAPFLAELRNNFYFHNFVEKNDSTLYFYNAASEIYVIKNSEYIDYAQYDQYPSNIFFASGNKKNNLLLWYHSGIAEFNKLETEYKNYIQKQPILGAYQQVNNDILAFDEDGWIHLYRNHEKIDSNIFHSQSQNINDIKLDNEGRYWVSTFDKGLYCYDNDSVILHLNIAQLQNLVFDSENHLWAVSNSHGIIKINKDILRYKTIDIEEFAYSGIRKISSANQGGLWLSNGKSLYYYNNDHILQQKLSIDNNSIENIQHLKDGNLIVSGESSRLYLIKNVRVDGQTIKHGKKIRLLANAGKVVTNKSEDKLYSFIHDRLVISDIATLRNSFLPFNKGRIKNIFFNKRDELVVNATRNYTYFRLDSMEHDSLFSAFDGKTIKSHLTLNSNYEIISTGEKELYLISPNKVWYLINDFQSQIDFNIIDMDYDGETLFFSTVKSIYFLSNPLSILSNNSIELKKLNIEFNNIYDIFYKDENLYVGSDDGLTFISVSEKVSGYQKPPKPYISRVLLDEEEISIPSNAIQLKNKKQLNIEFSSFNFSSIPSTYSYKLEGINENWISGNDRQVVYHNLDPGRYIFKLKARKNMEEYSDTVSLPIIVLPTFFQRPLTRIAIVFLVVLLGFLIIRSYYRRQIRSREKDYMLVTLENRALQSMMNPHFIFNSLGSIQKFLLENKPEEAGSYLSQFARLIRQTMNSIKSNHVLLDDEIERLRNYIELEQVRMNKRFDYSIIMDEKLEEEEYNIPSMIVQPFVENAIWHGISPLQETGILNVRFKYMDDKKIQITIEDNGIGFVKSSAFSKSKNNLNMASNLTQKRIRLIGEKYKVEAGFNKEELDPGKENPGARITLIVPVIA